MREHPALLIAGEWLTGKGEIFTACNPYDGQVQWQAASAARCDIALAVEVAQHAWRDWLKVGFTTRSDIMREFAHQLEQHKSELAQVISEETGKPRWESLTEVQSMIGKIPLSLSAYQQRSGEAHTAAAEGTARLLHRPHGVLAVFGPYNFPGHLPNGHIVPALLAGNCVLFKPSEYTPMTAELTCRLWLKAGLPSGVLSLLPGGRQTGEVLAQHPELDGLLFTGSSATGYALHRQLAGHPEKILALEMGGNNALIVEEVSDVERDAAVNLTIQSAFLSAGQRCTCCRRLLVKTGAEGDAFLQRLVDVSMRIECGPWNAEPQPFMGPVITRQVAERLLAVQQQWLDAGAHCLLQMRADEQHPALLSPGIIDVSSLAALPDNRSLAVSDDEFFGPLLQVYRYDSFDEAIALANHTRFGLSLGVISTQRVHYEQLLQEGRAGIINWNKPLTGALGSAPFGGIGASGNHRPGAFYAADYCAWPVAGIESSQLKLPANMTPGLHF